MLLSEIIIIRDRKILNTDSIIKTITIFRNLVRDKKDFNYILGEQGKMFSASLLEDDILGENTFFFASLTQKDINVSEYTEDMLRSGSWTITQDQADAYVAEKYAMIDIDASDPEATGIIIPIFDDNQDLNNENYNSDIIIEPENIEEKSNNGDAE